MSFTSFNFDNIRKEPLGTVYVVDDDLDVRDSMRRLLESQDYRVEAYDSGESFLAKYDPNSIAVLLIDQRMPGMPGTEVQEHLLARKATIPIVFLTGHGDVPMAVSVLKKGAADFLQKPVNPQTLLPIIEKLLAEAREQRVQSERQSLNEALLSKLTPREQQVLERIVAGRLNKQIADDLGISIKTVEAHRASIMDKTNSGTVADLMRVVLGAQSH
ncbi:MAG: response regulator transcription factor [Burkholderiaceae bacterium]|jgi:FixJ family two-component response regulator|nr:response regulator transcription factor [Burkholderiaceae bacterium]